MNELKKNENTNPGQITLYPSIIQQGTEFIVTAITPNIKEQVLSSPKELINLQSWLLNMNHLVNILNYFHDGQHLSHEL